jgi:hypothetical protein
VSPDLAVPPATLPLAAGAPPSLAAPPVTFSLAAGVPPGPAAPPATLYSAAGALPSTAASLAALPSVASAPPEVAPPVRPIAAPGAPPGHAFVITPALPPLPSHLRPRRPNPPPSRPPLAPTGLGRLLRSPYRMPPCFTPSCWCQVFHMSLSTRLAGPPCVAAPCRRLSTTSCPPSPHPCALLRMMLLPFSLPPGNRYGSSPAGPGRRLCS